MKYFQYNRMILNKLYSVNCKIVKKIDQVQDLSKYPV